MKKIEKNKNKKSHNIFDKESIFPVGISSGTSEDKKIVLVKFVGHTKENKDSIDIHVASSIALTVQMAKDLEKQLKDILLKLEK